MEQQCTEVEQTEYEEQCSTSYEQLCETVEQYQCLDEEVLYSDVVPISSSYGVPQVSQDPDLKIIMRFTFCKIRDLFSLLLLVMLTLPQLLMVYLR